VLPSGIRLKNIIGVLAVVQQGVFDCRDDRARRNSRTGKLIEYATIAFDPPLIRLRTGE
jgi:hypothetical protein